jgi:hypothetical protein
MQGPRLQLVYLITCIERSLPRRLECCMTTIRGYDVHATHLFEMESEVNHLLQFLAHPNASVPRNQARGDAPA